MANKHKAYTDSVPATLLPSKCVDIAPNDSTDLPDVVRGIEVQSAGTVKVGYVNGGTSIWTLVAGERKGGYITRVYATSTTVVLGDIKGLDP